MKVFRVCWPKLIRQQCPSPAMQLNVSTLNASLTMQLPYHQDRTTASPLSVMPHPAVDVAAADKRLPHCSSEKESGATETSIQMF